MGRQGTIYVHVVCDLYGYTVFHLTVIIYQETKAKTYSTERHKYMYDAAGGVNFTLKSA